MSDAHIDHKITVARRAGGIKHIDVCPQCGWDITDEILDRFECRTCYRKFDTLDGLGEHWYDEHRNME